MGRSDHDGESAETAGPSRTVEHLQRELDVLRASDATVRAVLELTDASVFAKDLEGRYVLVNRQGAAIVGLTPDAILGNTDHDLYPPDQADRFREHDRAVIESGLPNTMMMPLPRPTGTEMWLSHLVPLVDELGNVYGVAGIATDITERARQEALLEHRTQALETAQRIARLGTWSWDPNTAGLEISDELTRILGHEPGRRWGFDDLERMTEPDDLDAAVVAVQSAGDGNPVDHVVRVRVPDGSTRWLRLLSETTRDVHPDGSRGPVVGTVQDVTEHEEAERRRDELERRLQQSQRLETVGQLAGGVAHDFNNLLAVIGMQAELALQALVPSHAAANQLRELQGTVERASALTRQLLVFSRHEDHDDTVIDLRASLTGLAPLLGRSMGSHIELVVDLADDLHPVAADRSQIEQVLVNLGVNARDAMADGGTVTITGRNDVGPNGPCIRLTVADTGSGMPPDVVDRAFEPFFTTKPAGMGTGLGLPTVHGVVTRSGGTVEIRSEVGIGTSVEILLPASRRSPDGAEGPHVRSSDAPAVGRTVLIVEDLEPLGKLAATLLGRAGYLTILATSGQQALELAPGGTQVDLLLTDVMMPSMTGRELADRLRRARPGLPVIFMTGYTGGVLDLGEHTADDVVLSKPFTGPELVDAVAATLARRDAAVA